MSEQDLGNPFRSPGAGVFDSTEVRAPPEPPAAFGATLNHAFNAYQAQWHAWPVPIVVAGLIYLALVFACVLPALAALGPLACGLFACAIDNLRGRPVAAGALKRGWDVLGSALAAGVCILLLQLLPALFIGLTALAVFVLQFGSSVAAGKPPHATLVLAIVGAFAVYMLGILVTFFWSLWTGTRLMFVLPLIVDRGYSLSGAWAESWRVTSRGFWELLLLNFLAGLIGSLGIYVCYVGVVFTLPLYFLIIAAAYEERCGAGA